MAKTRMPRDDNSQSIPVLRFRTGGGQQMGINPSSSALSTQLPEGTRVITLLCSVNSYFETGDDSIHANSVSSHYIPAGIPYDIALGTDLSDTTNYHRYVSVLTTGDSGTAYISERE